MTEKVEEKIEKGMKSLFDKVSNPKYKDWILAIGGIFAVCLIAFLWYWFFYRKRREKT